MRASFVSLTALANVITFSYVQGDMKKLQLGFTNEEPYFSIENEAFEGDLAPFAVGMIAAIIQLIKALRSVLEDNVPEVLKKAGLLPDEAQDVKEHSQHEFDALNPMNKAKALSAFAQNVKIVQKIKPFMEAAIDNLKTNFEQVKEVLEELKTQQDKYDEHGKSCFGEKKHMPIECYEKIYGPITYTKQEREEWEQKVKGFHKGTYFNPEKVGKENMKQE